jgi:type I restriction-modification system DNA methylase subunit
MFINDSYSAEATVIQMDSFDCVLSNPPFGKGKAPHNVDYLFSHKMRIKKDVSRNCMSNFDESIDVLGMKATVDLDSLYVEHCINAAKKGGRIAVLIPNGFLSNSSTLPERIYTLSSCDLLASIGLPKETFLKGNTSVSTGILSFKKKFNKKANQSHDIFMAMIDDIGWDSRLRSTNKDDSVEVTEAFQQFQHDVFCPAQREQ